MESYTYPTSVLPVLRVWTPAAKLAHPTKVGFLAVQGDAIGGSLLESRSNPFDVRIQPSNGANGIIILTYTPGVTANPNIVRGLCLPGFRYS